MRFGELELDPARSDLRRDGRPLRAYPLVVRLLAYLLEHRDRVVPKEELLAAVWPDTAVADGTLAGTLKRLRQLVGDSGSRQAVIRTVRGQGYRFVAPAVEHPGPRGGAPGCHFVGRARELERLDAALSEALAGRGSLALIAGEPGIGKTRLAEELLVRARRAGVRAVTGGCRDPAGAPPYSPWIEALRELLEGLPDPELRGSLGSGAPELAALLPEIAERLRPPPQRSGAPADQAAFRLMDQVERLLRCCAQESGLVVRLDDLHWADASSLRLLGHVAQGLARARVLVVGTYREKEVGPVLAETLERVARAPGERLCLPGLDEGDVGRLARLLGGRELAPEEVRRLLERTGGNPFFVSELVRFGEGADGPGDLPARVRDAIQARVGGLSESTRALLEAAAVAGDGVEAGLAARAAGLEAERLMESVEEARAAGVLEGDAGGSLRFAHGLIGEAIYASLPKPRRAGLHLAVAQALADRERTGAPVPPSVIAGHLCRALPLGDPVYALHQLTRAAEEAFEGFAIEDALALYEQALALLERHPEGPRTRAETLLGLGRALGALGRHGEAADTLDRAAIPARRAGSAELLAEAALSHPLGGALAASHTGTPDERLVALLEEAAERLPSRDDPLRARVLARLATELYFTSDWARGVDLSQEALGMARRLGDPAILGSALVARHYCLWNPAGLEARLGLSREIVDVGRGAGDGVLEFQGLLSLVSDRLEIGDIPGVKRGLEEQRACAEALRLPLYRWAAMNTWPTLAIAEGRIDEAERLARETLAAAGDHENPDVVNGFSAHMFNVLRERDQLQALEPIVRQHVERFPEMPVWRCALAFVCRELEKHDEAREQFEVLARWSFRAIPRDMFYLFNLAMLADVCAFLGDAARAATLARMLRPYAGRNVTVGGLVMAGAASHYLGLARAAEGRLDEAERQFGDAMTMNERMGARLWRSRSALAWAEALLAQGGPDDPSHARSLVEDALNAARELGLVAVERRARELCAAL